MTAEQFAYWMQGFAEMTAERPTAEQWQSIKDHLQTVFVKVTPPVGAKPLVPPLDLSKLPYPTHPHPNDWWRRVDCKPLIATCVTDTRGAKATC